MTIRRSAMRAAVTVGGACAVSVGLASEAWALCPNCLGQTRSLTPTLELIGAFLLVPFLIAYAVLQVVRSHDAD